MKRFLLLFLVLAIWVTPHILTSSPRVGNLLKDLVAGELKAQVDFGGITWYWLPTPHLSFVSARIDSPEFLLRASKIDVYPDWLELARGGFGIYGIGLEDVHLTILKLANDKNERPVLPKWIEVKNGFLEITKGVKLPGFFPFKDRRPYIKNLYGHIDLGHDWLSAKLKGNIRQAQAVDLRVQMDLKRFDYELKGSIKQFDLSALKIKPLTSAKQFPSYGFLNLDFNVKGQGLEKADGYLKVYSNCFVSGNRSLTAIFSCGSLGLKFRYDTDQVQVVLQNLDFQHPRLHLTGTLVLKKRQGEPWLSVELKGKDLDLAEIRRVLLAMSIKDKDVDDYCNAIRAGTIEWATLKMVGPASKWHSLSDMCIRGSARDVRIYVKDEDFFVDSASGPFEIVDGVLHVTDARARLRKTVGTSGNLVLGLSKGRDQFKLDLELVAPAQDVKWALFKFTKEKQLHKELELVSDLTGRLRGKLQIGDTKHHKNVRVYVKEARLSGFYQRLDMKVDIVKGQARYSDDTLSLIHLSGDFGPNRVSDLSATVSWKDGRLRVRVDRGSGRVVAQSIVGLCKKFDVAQDFFNSHKVTVSGPLIINRIKFYVDFSDPASLTYLVAFSPVGVDLETDFMPFPVFLKGGSMYVSTAKVSASGLKVKMAGNLYRLWMQLRHRRFHSWTGFIKTNGYVDNRLWGWLRKEGLDLGDLTPRLPFYAKNFKIGFVSGKPVDFDGKILWKDKGATLTLKVRRDRDLLHISKAVITKGPKSAFISFKRSAGRKLQFSFDFKGELSKDMLQAILMRKSFLDGVIEGEFAFKFLPFLHKNPIFFSGRLHIEDLKWPLDLDDNVDLVLRNIELSARNGKGNLKAHVRFLEDSFDLNGTIETVSDSLKGHLKLTAPLLSSRVLSYIQQISDKKETSIAARRNAGRKIGDIFREITKRIFLKMDFDVKEARYAVTDFAKKGEDRVHEIILKNLRGNASLRMGTLEGLEAYSGDTCGLDLYLKKSRLDGHMISEFSVITPRDRKVRFEQVLDCLGIEQDMITGIVNFNLYLRGGDRVLLGNGNLKIKARDGYIHKFGLLSKIFSVVNIVDIFSLNKGLLEGTSPYKKLLVDAKIRSGKVHMEKAYIKGPGINFYATGDVYLNTKLLDLVIFIQPLKTVDKIITSLPIIGGIIGGKNRSLFAIPVKVSGNWSDPKVDTLQTKTVTDIFKKLIFNVLTAPFNIKN